MDTRPSPTIWVGPDRVGTSSQTEFGHADDHPRGDGDWRFQERIGFARFREARSADDGAGWLGNRDVVEGRQPEGGENLAVVSDHQAPS